MLNPNQMPSTIADWYCATQTERNTWVTGAIPEMREALAGILLEDRNQKLDYHKLSATHPNYPDLTNLEISQMIVWLKHGDLVAEQQRRNMEQSYRLEKTYPNATDQELSVMIVREDFGNEVATNVQADLSHYQNQWQPAQTI